MKECNARTECELYLAVQLYFHDFNNYTKYKIFSDVIKMYCIDFLTMEKKNSDEDDDGEQYMRCRYSMHS